MYSDEDGSATPQSQSVYDIRIRTLIYATCFLSWLGYGVAISETKTSRISIIETESDVLGWSKSLWLLLSLHSVGLLWKDNPINTYNAGLRGSIFSFLISILIFLRIHSSTENSFSKWSPTTFQLFTSLLVAIIQVLFPRRPRLFDVDGKDIDFERSSCALSRYSMQWCASAMTLAGKPATIDELPVLDYSTRSKSQPLIVLKSLEGTLWNRILYDRYFGFVKQWCLMFFRAFVTFGSPYCVMRLLKSLEDNHGRVTDAWIWLIGLALSSICQYIIHYYLFWIQWSEMGVPVRAQLIMSIFQKALRRKDSKENNKDLSTKDALQKHKPEAVSLISSDSVSLSKFTANGYIIPAALVKFFFACLFLFQLVGWQSTLIGLMTSILFVPIHMFVMRQQRTAKKTLTAARDKKTKVVSEALYSLRQIKLSALEAQWEEYIESFRQEEIVQLRNYFFTCSIRSVWRVASPFFVAVISISAYAYLHGTITPSIIFPMIEVFPHLEGTLGFVPIILLDYYGARSNSKRIEEFLRRPEQKKVLSPSLLGQVLFRGCSIAWPSDIVGDEEGREKNSRDRFSLRGINLDFPVGELSVISGKTGSGKSLLLAAIIGEIDLLSGTINAPSAAADGYPIAFVSQTPWLQNATIKENILFGNSMDKERYEKVLTACALRPDLAALSKGDETLIGLRGVKLSGGQRARLAFARAIYSRAKLLVLDDIFSALDSHVSKEIFEALTGELGEGRTRILVTHQVSLCLSKAKFIVRIANNTIQYAGNAESIEKVAETLDTGVPSELRDLTSSQEENQKKDSSGKSSKTGIAVKQAKNINGRTDAKVYKKYFLAAGGLVFVVTYPSGLIIKQILNTLTTWLMGRINSTRSKIALDLSENTDGFQQYLYLYTLTSFLAIVAEAIFSLNSFSGSIHASRTLFRQMTSKILRMPLTWLDNTSIGQMLQVFTVDMRLVDDSALTTMSEFINCAVELSVIFCVGLYNSKYTSILTFFLLLWCSNISRAYIKARSTVKRADAGPTADILEQFTSITSGLPTIRAFGAADNLVEQMHGYIDRLSKGRRHFWIFNRWIGLQFALVGIAFSTGTGIILLSTKSIIDPSLVGFSLTFSMGFSKAIFTAVNNFGVLETEMDAVGSVISYTELEAEDQRGIGVFPDWPPQGLIQIKDLSISYASNLPLVLKNLSFTIPAGQRMGIVGRTGAGKSSLTLSLLRLLQPRSGSILIDGIDISTIKLSLLRSKIAFIPQDPVLFSGTIRSNLDYFHLHSAEKIESVLRKVHLLADENDEKTDKFLFTPDSSISTGGTNISQGQRQLLCLARVLLQSPKIIVLDEATSAVDNATDLLIQETIRAEFKGTLIVVAHRLRTVANFDQILVLSEGEIKEMGRPEDLLRKRGAFWELVKDSQDKEAFAGMV